MQTYKFDTKISENGMISLPYAMPDLYGRDVELFIVVPQQKKEQKPIKQTKAQEFVAQWAGFLKRENIDTEKAKYEYLSEKYR